MRLIRHPAALLLLPLLLSTSTYAHAAAANETLPDAQALIQLELKAQQASPRDQCVL